MFSCSFIVFFSMFHVKHQRLSNKSSLLSVYGGCHLTIGNKFKEGTKGGRIVSLPKRVPENVCGMIESKWI
jgi:hypothetical protein